MEKEIKKETNEWASQTERERERGSLSSYQLAFSLRWQCFPLTICGDVRGRTYKFRNHTIIVGNTILSRRANESHYWIDSLRIISINW